MLLLASSASTMLAEAEAMPPNWAGIGCCVPSGAVGSQAGSGTNLPPPGFPIRKCSSLRTWARCQPRKLRVVCTPPESFLAKK